ncbi:MAG TPA: hypothetical protein VII73_04045 [Caulobacteraceae bacterium]
MVDRRTARVWEYTMAAIVGGAIIMLAPVAFLGRPATRSLIHPDRIVIMTIASALAMGWALVFATLSWRRFDEFAKEGSKFAWYWGGSIGLAATAPAYVFIGLGGLHWLWPSMPVGLPLLRAFVIGYCLPLFSQMIGFAVALALWRAARR